MMEDATIGDWLERLAECGHVFEDGCEVTDWMRAHADDVARDVVPDAPEDYAVVAALSILRVERVEWALDIIRQRCNSPAVLRWAGRK